MEHTSQQSPSQTNPLTRSPAANVEISSSGSLDQEFVEREVQIFTTFSTQFDGAVKNLAKMAADQTTKWGKDFSDTFLSLLQWDRCQNHYKREFQMIGKSFSQLGQAMEGDGGNYNPGLNNAVIATGKPFSIPFYIHADAQRTIKSDVEQENATRKLAVYTRSSPGWTGSTWPT